MDRVPNAAMRGRDAELAALGEQLDRIRSGVGAVVAVEGGAGMGKTRLLAEAARMARRMSFKVGGGVAQPTESVVELAVLMFALFDGAESVLDRSALRDPLTGRDQRYWLLQDLQALLERVVVCLDDLPWADSGTVTALRMLPPRLVALPIAWVFAFRPDHGSADLRSAVDQLERGDAEKIVSVRLRQKRSRR